MSQHPTPITPTAPIPQIPTRNAITTPRMSAPNVLVVATVDQETTLKELVDLALEHFPGIPQEKIRVGCDPQRNLILYEEPPF